MPHSDLHVTCITTGRADYSLMRWPMHEIADRDDMRLSIVAGGGHLAASQGATISEIMQDGFQVDETVEMYLDSISATGPAIGAGLATMGIAQALARLTPDWVMLLGDRFEVLGAATAAAVHRIPICHLCGGDVTEDAYDDAFRHAITKLSHLHCTSTQNAASNVLQMGEEPWRVVHTGSPGLDALHKIPQLSRAEVFTALGLPDRTSTFLITLHPTTLKKDFGQSELHALLAALDEHPDAQLVFTGVNADTGGAIFDAIVQSFAAQRPNAIFKKSLGQTLYFNAVRQMQMVIGNSSSGLYEVPSLSVPTINIGDRQKGRLRATSVFDCNGTKDEILAAINAASAFLETDIVNPFGDGHSAIRIVDALQTVSRDRTPQELLTKRFCSLR
ncbi:UDP-N-acetylglucosamine 2-epimerase [uncultured Ruegeria sp.]|uniref:UDP-N-acetylglucosamine 2-epimerase n=1 Tax=uncultured Ruegeria sp. TaxID=259304 RepID=UPI0034265318